jgi:hypothetical protein
MAFARPWYISIQNKSMSEIFTLAYKPRIFFFANTVGCGGGMVFAFCNLTRKNSKK